MFDIGIIYDYNEAGTWPSWMIVRPTSGEFNWRIETLYVPILTPFKRIYREDLDETDFGLSIVQTELVVNTERPEAIGIYLPRVKERIYKIRGEEYTPFFHLCDIKHFVIQMSDIEIIAQMNLTSMMNFR